MPLGHRRAGNMLSHRHKWSVSWDARLRRRLPLLEAALCLTALLSPAIAQEYCEIETECGPYIERVEIPGIDNTTSCTAYQFYGAAYGCAYLLEGATNQLTITVADATPQDYTRAWIDWDCDFEFETNEIVLSDSGTGLLISDFLVPPGITYADTRMRIRVCRGSLPEPCGYCPLGEVEDYPVRVRWTFCNCGDADDNTIWNISDAVYLIAYIFGGASAPDPICLGDTNGDCIVNISDAIYQILYDFGGGPEPHCSPTPCNWNQ